MNRATFMAQLKERLKHLPYDEIKSAVDYYEEYFDEAGPENEMEVISKLGTPADISSKIISEFALKEPPVYEKKTKKGMSVFWIVMLAIFASPIALPLAITFLVVIITLFIAIISVIITVGAVAFALVATGLALFVASIILLFTNFPTGIFFLGACLTTLSIGSIFIWLTVFLFRVSFKGITRLMAKFLNKKGNLF